MRATQLLSLALSGAGLVAAVPKPQDSQPTTAADAQDDLPTTASPDPNVALDQLAQLGQYANLATTEALGNGTSSKRAPCTPANLKVRRNW